MKGRELRFTVEGNPVPKARPRVVVSVAGKAHAFTPRRTAWWEEHVAYAAKLAMGEAGYREPFAGPISLEIGFFRQDHTRCDLDNLAKGCMDAMNKIVWNDDAQIKYLLLWKTVDHDEPRVVVELREVDNDDQS